MNSALHRLLESFLMVGCHLDGQALCTDEHNAVEEGDGGARHGGCQCRPKILNSVIDSACHFH